MHHDNYKYFSFGAIFGSIGAELGMMYLSRNRDVLHCRTRVSRILRRSRMEVGERLSQMLDFQF